MKNAKTTETKNVKPYRIGTKMKIEMLATLSSSRRILKKGEEYEVIYYGPNYFKYNPLHTHHGLLIPSEKAKITAVG